MTERRDRIAVSTSRTTVELPWSSRDQLLHEIRSLDGAEAIRTAFEAVGATQPVPLAREDEVVLLEAIDAWAEGVTAGGLPDGVWDLRNALADELDDAPDTAA